MLLRNAAVIALISGSAILLAGEFWQDKQPSDWTDKDVQRLVTKSPWAKPASLSFNPDRMAGMGRQGGMGGRGGMGGPGMGGGGMGGPGMGGPGMGGPGMGGPGMGGPGMGGPRGEEGSGGMPNSAVTVRWESAAPLRAAASRIESPEDTKKVAEWTQEFYVVTVTGLPMMRPRGRGEEEPPDQERIERMQQQIQERMKAATALRIKGKDAIAPTRVETAATPDGRTISFLFPRSAGISLDDKEVAFETAMGPREVKVKFTLRDMLFGGKLAL
ncbi:MAG: hypothetical protein ABSH05_00810 [Bryobacteraceae bacterium]|jgi:hypothetical protein